MRSPSTTELRIIYHCYPGSGQFTLDFFPTPGTRDGKPYHEACCNLEVLVPDLGQAQGQGQAQVLWQTQRVEVVLASAAASQASDAFPAQPFAGGQEEVAPWPASYRP